MNNEGLNKLGHAVNTETGETVMEVFGPPNALTEGADILSQLLYGLSEVVIRGLLPDQGGGGLGGEFGYGAYFDFKKGRWSDEDQPENHGPMCFLRAGGAFCTCRPVPE